MAADVKMSDDELNSFEESVNKLITRFSTFECENKEAVRSLADRISQWEQKSGFYGEESYGDFSNTCGVIQKPRVP